MDEPEDVVFSPAVKAEQSRQGSRAQFEGHDWKTEITDDLRQFLGVIDTFFFATASADGRPYIQHRGGPPGFLKPIGSHTLAFADFTGNRQFITLGHLTENDRAHIFILLDRPLPATTLKAWLMQLNLDVPVLKSALTLSNSQCALKWTLDITSCQNDRLIYIAEPEFQGMKSPVKASERILIVKKNAPESLPLLVIQAQGSPARLAAFVLLPLLGLYLGLWSIALVLAVLDLVHGDQRVGVFLPRLLDDLAGAAPLDQAAMAQHHDLVGVEGAFALEAGEDGGAGDPAPAGAAPATPAPPVGS